MKPFLKWAGGKRWLFGPELMATLPKFERYIEPFLGGGAGFFALAPGKAVLADINPELINVYTQIRQNPTGISQGLRDFQSAHSKLHYYAVRSAGFVPGLEGAVRTLYLNRTCWNGLFRLNLKGQFNVPIGTKSSIYDPRENFETIAVALGNAEILCTDFEGVLDASGSGDLVFVDPPYTVKHNVNGFVKYNESIFSWEDQIRLSNALRNAKKRGASVILTNADHECVRSLYAGFGSIASVTRASVISGKASGRSQTTEMLLVA